MVSASLFHQQLGYVPQKVFFLDEPTSGLDPGLDYKMMHLLRSLADRGQTVVLSTHATSNRMICDSVCFLATGGRLVYFGPPNKALTFFRQQTFDKIYPMLETNAEHPEAAANGEARWSIGALGSTLSLHSDKLGGDNLIGNQSIYCGTLFSTCTQSQATTHLLSLWAALGAMILLLGFVTAICLKLKDRHRQY